MLRLCSLLAAALLSGCAVRQPAVPVGKFLAGDLVAVQSFAAKEALEGDPENHALLLNVEGQCQLLLGEIPAARRSFETAARIMGNWATSGSEATAAIVGSESSKTYKGDPYEKAMNAFYLALCYLWLGEPDNARAACKRGILADAEVGDEQFQADNALLFWMAGRMSDLMGSADGDDFYAEAVTAHEFALQHGSRGDSSNRVLSAPRQGNVVMLFECGLGPEKYRDGGQEELARFRPQPHPATRARARIDGRSAGTSTVVLDVNYQATTRGGTAMEGIRKGKAVLRTVSTTAGIILLDQATRNRGDTARTQAITGGALLILGLLTSTAADVRHWPTLPSTVQVLTATVPPGAHEIEVEFLDGQGRPLPNMTQRVTVDVPPRGDAWYLFRSLPIL